MSPKSDAGQKSTAFQTLRKRAEEKIAGGDPPFKNMSADEIAALIHELHIHQSELEMQNEELQKSQADSEHSRKAYQDLWEQSPAGYLILDVAGRVKAANRAVQRLFGRPENALLDERLATLVAPESQVTVYLMLERKTEAGIADRQEIEIVKPDGAATICLLEVSSLRDETDQEQIQALLIDITKEKHAEDDLKKNEQEKIAILDSLIEHVIYHDRELNILWANSAACESVHMTLEDLLGHNCYEIWPKTHTPCENCPVIKARDTGQPHMIEKMTPDGRWWNIKGQPIKNSDGHVTGMTELTLEITERKRAEEAIRQAKSELEILVAKRTAELVNANEKLHQEIIVRKDAEKSLQANTTLLATVFDALQDLLIVIDKDFRVVMSNWKDHAYISEKDCQGHPFCYEVLMNRKRPCDACHATEVFTTGEIKQLELTNPIDGKIRDISVLPMLDDKGNVVAIIEHLRDISDQKRAHEEIHNLSRQLIKAQEDERQMISRELHDRVAQDLSTLLIGLNTLSDHPSTTLPDVPKKALELSKIVRGTIGSVRNLSYNLRLPGLDNMGLIPALSMYCDDFAETTGLTVDFQATGVSALKLDFNTEMNLYRLIQEGLNNIHKHAAANQAIIKLVGTYPSIILRIEDNGKGFDVEKRARTAESEKHMGLSSMAERVHLLQGEMTIQSRPGKGTKILIKFPYQDNKDD